MQLGGFSVMVNPGFLLRRIHRRGTEPAELKEFLNQNSFRRTLRVSAVQIPKPVSQKLQKRLVYEAL
jgi:hypothetical protein